MKKLILLFLLCPLFLLAQEIPKKKTLSISGITVDNNSKTPISVSINIYKKHVRLAYTRSNKEGKFKIEIDTSLYNIEDIELRFREGEKETIVDGLNYDMDLSKLSVLIYKYANYADQRNLEMKYMNFDLVIPYRISNKWGYINMFNDTVSAPKYDFAFPMLKNRGRVSVNKKYGFVNKKGDVIIKIQYDLAQDFNTYGQAEVQKQNKIWSIDINGAKVEPNRNYAFCGTKNGTLESVTKKNGLFGVAVNYDGVNQYTIPPIYKSLKNTPDRTYIAQDSKGMYGIIDINNKELTVFEYDSIQVHHGSLKIFKNGKQGILYCWGSIMAHPIYDEVICVGKLAKAYRNGKLLGYIYKGVEYWED